MKLKMYLLLALLIFCFLQTEAQVLDWKRSFPVQKPIAVSADAQGNIYLSTRGGEIKKYSPQGVELQTYSPPSAAHFGVLDASSTLQVRAFNENTQTMVYLDRFLNPSSSFDFSSEWFNFITALCWSAGNTLWFVDAGKLELKRWRMETREVLLTLNLNQYIPERDPEIVTLKEHQHALYLFGSRHLLVFDQLGNFEKQMPLPEWKSVAFSENEMILLRKDSLSFIHLHSGKERNLPLPEGKEYQHLAYSRGEIYLFSPDQVDVYKLKP